jgi:hypothetical protein
MTSWSRSLRIVVLGLGGVLLLGARPAAAAEPKPEAAAQTASGKLGFTLGKAGELAFDTGVLRGSLHRDGRSSGLQQVVYVPTNTPVAKWSGWFTHYRVITADIRYPKAAWSWTSTAKVLPDGAAEIRWAASEDRPFEMTALYRFTAPDTFDLVTTVKAQKDLKKFDIFLASYFEGFTKSLVYAKPGPGTDAKPGMLDVTKALGSLMLFPRDEQALAIVQDGRWQKPPHPVGFKFMPPYAGALSIRRDEPSGLTALLMAPPKDCFAISTYHGEEPHRSVYLSMFGRDIEAGQTDQARCRMVFGPGISDQQAIERYEAYLNAR